MKALITEYDRAIADLRKQYPQGAQVDFFIMEGQKIPSTGTIQRVTIEIYSFGDIARAYPNVSIRHDQAKPNSRYPIRSVSPDRILAVYFPEDEASQPGGAS